MAVRGGKMEERGSKARGGGVVSREHGPGGRGGGCCPRASRSQLRRHLDFSHARPTLDCDSQNCEAMHLCCCEALDL